MLSRVAQSIYWIGRYLERAENVARFVGVNLHLMIDSPVDQNAQWAPLVQATGDVEAYMARYSEMSRDKVLRFFTSDASYPNSILSCLAASRENARSIRETITKDLWEEINKFYLFVREAVSTDSAVQEPYVFCQRVCRAAQLLVGVLETTVSHGEAFLFQCLGRFLERADQTSRILDVKYFILLPRISAVGTPIDAVQWAALLKSVSALDMYRQRFHRIAPKTVAEFLILDQDFPRAIRYAIDSAERSLKAISGSRSQTYSNLAERALGRLRSDLDYAEIDEIVDRGLHEYIDGFQRRINEVDRAIFDTFFALRPIEGSRH